MAATATTASVSTPAKTPRLADLVPVFDRPSVQHAHKKVVDLRRQRTTIESRITGDLASEDELVRARARVDLLEQQQVLQRLLIDERTAEREFSAICEHTADEM